MKRNYFLALISVLSIVLFLSVSSCKKEEQKPVELTPGIELGQTEISVPGEGGQFSVTYTLNNPVETEKVIVDHSENWIRDIHVESDKITFSVDVNENETGRETKLIVSYAEDVKELNIRQAEYPGLVFKVEFLEITESTVTFNIYPCVDDEGYVVLSIDKAYYDYVGSDEKLIQIVEDLIKTTAEANEMSIEEYLKISKQLKFGNTEKLKFDGFLPGTENYLLILGMDLNGKATSDLHAEHFTTKGVEKIDASFEITSEVNGPDAKVKVVPSSKDFSYYFDMLEKADYEETGQSPEEFAQSLIMNMFQIGELLGMSHEDVLEVLCVKGTVQADFTGRLNAETEYFAFAGAVQIPSGTINSDVTTHEFTTGEVEPSDNQLTLELSDVNCDRVTFMITASNDDPYGFLACPAADISGMTDKEIVKYTMEHGFDITDPFIGSLPEPMLYTGLTPDTEYEFVVFGYQAGAPTTKVIRESFATPKAGDPYEFTFTVNVSDITKRGAVIEVVPTPDNVLYYFDLCNKGTSASTIMEAIESNINQYIEAGVVANALDYYQRMCDRGIITHEYSDLVPGTEYQVFAFSVDEKKGEPATDVLFSDPFSTEENVVSDATIVLEHDKYFDVDELAKVDDMYEDFVGMGLFLMPIEAVTTGDVAFTYTGIFMDDITDVNQVTDDELIYNLVDLGLGEMDAKANYLMGYDELMTLVAVAEDVNGNYSVCYREKIQKDKAGASPISEFQGAPAFKSLIQKTIFSTPEMKLRRADLSSVATLQEFSPVNSARTMDKISGLRAVELTQNHAAKTVENTLRLQVR